MKQIIGSKSSTFLQKAIILDDGKPLNFDDYHIYKTLLDMDPVKEIVFYTGRQVGKSIFQATRILQHAFIPNFRMTYIAPTDRQVKEFSRFKLGMILSSSPVLKNMLLSTKSPLIPPELGLSSNDLLNDVYNKLLATRASIKLGFAADSVGVDRIRGGSADMLTFDEAQSIDISGVFPVVKPLLKSSDYKFMVFSGTPLNEHDPLSVRFERTTQHTMVVKCEGCNRYNTLDNIKMITPKGLACMHCGKILKVRNGFFHPMNPSSSVLGIHINRLMFPMTTERIVHWQDVLDELEDPNISEDKFIQETLGRPGGSTSRMIEPSDVMALGVGPDYIPGELEAALKGLKNDGGQTLVYSIDWGGGADPLGKLAEAAGQSRTGVTLWHCSVQNRRIRMKKIYHKVYPLEHPSASIDEILDNIAILPKGTLIAADALGGTYGNDKIRRFVRDSGGGIFIPIQLGEAGGSFKMNPEKDRLVVHRSKMLTKFFLKVKEQELVLPKATALIKEITNHYCAEVEFENELGKRIWRKKAGTVDDLLFCALFAFVAYGFFYNQAELKD